MASTDPANGARLRGPLTDYTVNFNDLVLLTTLSADDLTFDGIAATGVTIVDGDTAVFTVPAGFGEGLVHVAIAAGAIEDIQGTPIEAFAATYYNDVTAPRVVASSIQEGETDIPAGDLVYTVTFSEAMNPSVDIYSAAPSTGNTSASTTTPPASSSMAPAPRRRSPTPACPRMPTRSPLQRRAFQDIVGIALDGEPVAWPIPPNESGDGDEGGNFFVDFATDAGTQALPTPLVAVNPLGSLIYQTPYDTTGTSPSPAIPTTSRSTSTPARP